MNRGRIKKDQIELLYNRYAPTHEMTLNLVEVGHDETVIKSILIRADEIPNFLDAVTNFERFYRLPVVGEE